MRICFIAGANSVHSERWIAYFAGRGHAVCWITLEVEGRPVPPGVEYHRIRRSFFKPLNPFLYAVRIRRILGEFRPDVLHVHQIWIDGIVAAMTGFGPLVMTPWGSDVLIAPRSAIKKPWIRYALKKADLITCDGENTRRALLRLGAKEDRIRMVCFGVDTERYGPGPKSTEFIESFNLRGSPVVISLRNFKSVYDVETLVLAMPLVLGRVPSAKFVLIGDGPRRDSLAALARSLGVDGAARFAGSLDAARVPDALRSADVYVSTALSDSGLAASTAEAMACGLPVVVTDSGSNGDWIREGENGYVIPQKDPAKLADKIVFLLGNDAVRKSMGANNVQVIRSRNDYGGEMGKMNSMYARLSGGGSR